MILELLSNPEGMIYLCHPFGIGKTTQGDSHRPVFIVGEIPSMKRNQLPVSFEPLG